MDKFKAFVAVSTVFAVLLFGYGYAPAVSLDPGAPGIQRDCNSDFQDGAVNNQESETGRYIFGAGDNIGPDISGRDFVTKAGNADIPKSEQLFCSLVIK